MLKRITILLLLSSSAYAGLINGPVISYPVGSGTIVPSITINSVPFGYGSTDTNTVIIFGAGSNIVNGVYAYFGTNVTYPGAVIYSNTTSASPCFFWYDPGNGPFAAITTNGTDYQVGNLLYERYNSPATILDCLYNTTWDNQSNALTTLGSLPNPFLIFGQRNDTAGTLQLTPLLNALTFAATNINKKVHITGTNYIRNNLWIPDGVVLSGDNRATSFVLNTNMNTSMNVYMGNQTVLTNVYVGGYINVAYVSNSIYKSELFSRIDGLFFVPGYDKFFMQDSIMHSSADLCTAPYTSVFNYIPYATFVNNTFDGNGSYPGGINSAQVRCVSVGVGVWNFIGNKFIATDGGSGVSNNVCIQITGSGGNSTSTVYLYNNTYYAHSPLTGYSHIVDYNGAGSNTNAVFEQYPEVPWGPTNIVGGSVILQNTTPFSDNTNTVAISNGGYTNNTRNTTVRIFNLVGSSLVFSNKFSHVSGSLGSPVNQGGDYTLDYGESITGTVVSYGIALVK